MPAKQEGPTVSPIGHGTPRVDGPVKVSGKAQYTSDFHFPGLLYAVPVEATIANGRVVKLDTAAAEKMPACVPFFIAKTSERSSVPPWDPGSRVSVKSAARRLRTMSFATTAN